MFLDRAGKFVTQLDGYKAFIPHPLPPNPPIRYDEKLQFLLSKADRALARLEGVATVLSNRDRFVAIFAMKEALLSFKDFGNTCLLIILISSLEEQKYEKEKEIQFNRANIEFVLKST